MNVQFFKDSKKKFTVVFFLEPEVFERRKKELETLAAQKNVKLVVQPCPFEGVEFLSRIAHELYGHQSGLEKDLFWQALALKSEISDEVWGKVADHQHKYLCAILEQNAPVVEKEGKVLQSFSDLYS